MQGRRDSMIAHGIDEQTEVPPSPHEGAVGEPAQRIHAARTERDCTHEGSIGSEDGDPARVVHADRIPSEREDAPQEAELTGTLPTAPHDSQETPAAVEVPDLGRHAVGHHDRPVGLACGVTDAAQKVGRFALDETDLDDWIGGYECADRLGVPNGTVPGAPLARRQERTQRQDCRGRDASPPR